MNWLYKLDYKYGRKAPKNLMLFIVGGQIVAWLVIMLANMDFYYTLTLTRSGLMHLELWRLVSFLFVPELTTNPLFFALGVYLLYFIGSSLERAWGSFKFDVYFLAGVVSAWVACLITGWGGTSALTMSLFFAFAYLYPNVELLLFFFIPVKVKWLGYIAGAFYVIGILGSLLRLDVLGALSQIIGVANFLLFFGKGMFTAIKEGYTARQRRKQWQNQWRDR